MMNINEVILPEKELLFDYINQIYSLGQVTNNGSMVKRIEDCLATYTKSKFVLSTSSGTMALHLALRYLGKKQGQIITTPLSFIASSSTIVWENYSPVFCDVDINTWCLDCQKVEALITKETIAILAVNLFGNTCDIEKLELVAKKNNITLIFDSAHCFGTKYKGQSCLNFGDISISSFHASKIFSTVEGGGIFTQNKETFDHLFKMRYFGKNLKNEEEMLGTNGKMSEFHAAYGLASFQKFSIEMERRKEIALRYQEYFSKRSSRFVMQIQQKDAIVNNSYFPILINDIFDMDKLVQLALKKDILLKRYFYPLLSEMSFLSEDKFMETKNADFISQRIICLPIHSRLSDENVDSIISFIDNTVKHE
jgi:dTDP-4-amino-4,6-dideoxygalactose transaminase